MRTLKITLGLKDGSTSTVSIANAATDNDITEVKLSAFVEAYNAVKGNTIDTFTKAVVTSSAESIVYPVQ